MRDYSARGYLQLVRLKIGFEDLVEVLQHMWIINNKWAPSGRDMRGGRIFEGIVEHNSSEVI